MPLFHARFATPIGDAVAVLDDDALVVLRFDASDEAVLDAESRLRATIPRDDEAAAELAEQLDEYFSGDRTAFTVPLDLRLVSGFTRTALEAIVTIPYAETASYGEVAVLAGAPRAARAVGTACASTPISVVVPAHRVVRSDGSPGEYGGRPEVKRFLLDLEASRSG